MPAIMVLLNEGQKNTLTIFEDCSNTLPGQFGHETINTIDLVQKLLFQGTWTLLQMHEILLLSYRLSKTSIRKFLKYEDKFEIVKIDNC